MNTCACDPSEVRDRVVSYLACHAADRELDIARTAMQVSAMLNEVLEALDHRGGVQSCLRLMSGRTAAGVALEVIVNAGSGFLAFLEGVQRRVRTGEARAWYEGRLAQRGPDDGPSSPALVELMTRGQTTLGLVVENTAAVRFLITLRLREQAA